MFKFFASVIELMVESVFWLATLLIMATLYLGPVLWFAHHALKGDFNFLFFVLMIVWPVILYTAFWLFDLATMRKPALKHNRVKTITADELLYGSDKPLYSWEYLLAAETPYTLEHLSRYGELD